MSEQTKEIKIQPIDISSADESSKQALILLTEAKGLTIKGQEGYDKAGSLLVLIKGRLKSLDTLRKSITKPLDEAKARIMDLFRVPLTNYEEAETIVKKSMLVYDDEQEKLRKAEEDKLAREAEKKRKELEVKAEKARKEGKDAKADQLEEKANNTVAPILAPTIERPSGIQYRDHWTAEVTNFEWLPNEYKLSNMPMLNKVAQSTKGALKIPGVVFKKEKIVASKYSNG